MSIAETDHVLVCEWVKDGSDLVLDHWAIRHVSDVTYWQECTREVCNCAGHTPEQCDHCRCHEADECIRACQGSWPMHHDPDGIGPGMGCCCDGDGIIFDGVPHDRHDGDWTIEASECICQAVGFIDDGISECAQEIASEFPGRTEIPVNIECEDYDCWLLYCPELDWTVQWDAGPRHFHDYYDAYRFVVGRCGRHAVLSVGLGSTPPDKPVTVHCLGGIDYTIQRRSVVAL